MPSSLLLGVVTIISILLLSASLGLRVLLLSRSNLRTLQGWEKPVLVTALGLGCWQILPFALFTLHWGHPYQIRIATALAALLLLPDVYRVLRSAKRYLATLRGGDRSQKVFVGLLCLLLTTIFLRSLLPAIDGDVSSYHLPSVMRYMQAGGFIYLPTLTPTNWPLALQLLYAPLLAFHPEAPTSTLLYLCGILTLGVMALWAHRLIGKHGAIGAIGLYLVIDGFSYQGFWYQMSSSMIDLGLTLFTTCAVYSLYRAKAGSREEEADWVRLSAVFAGLAGTTKLTGIWVIASLCLVLCVVLYRERISIAHILKSVFRYAGTALCFVLPWFIKTWVLTGNPLYPMFYRLFGGREWTAEGWALYQRSHLIWNTPAGMMPTPQVLAQTHLKIAAVGTLLGLLLMVSSRKKPYAVPAMFASAFLICISVGNFFHLRFLMPAFPSIMVCLACLFLRFPKFYSVVLPLLSLFVVLQKAVIPTARFAPTALEMVTKLETRREAFRASDQFDMAEYINSKLSSEARVLLGCYDYAPLLYHVEGLWPELQDSIHYDSHVRLTADLKRLNVQYLLLNPTYPDWCSGSHSCRERLAREIPPLMEVAQKYGSPLHTAKGFTLYRLNFTP